MAWAGTPVQASGAIPLMNAAGTAAVNSASDYRQGLLGAFLAPGPGGPMVWRPGVLPSSAWAGANSNVDLSVMPTPTASNQVNIAAGSCVIPRSGGAGGPYIVTFNAASTLTTDAAASTNPRIDVVYVQLTDAALGDSGTQGGQLAIVNGTPGASPAVPAVPSNAIALAQLFRATSVNTVTGANITDVRKSSGLCGGIRCLLPGDLNGDAGSYIGEVTYDAVTSRLSGLRYWGIDDVWHGIGTRAFSQPTPAADLAHMGYLGFSNVGSITVPDPGFAYRIQAVGECAVSCNSANPTAAAGVDAMIIVGGTTVARTRLPMTPGPTNNCVTEVALGLSVVYTGSQTVVFQIFNPNGSAYIDALPSSWFQFRASIIPV